VPQLDPVPLRIGNPTESADTFHDLHVINDVGALGSQLREHGIEVVNPEVDHRRLGAGAEVVGLIFERGEDSRARRLVPQAVVIGVQAQNLSVSVAKG
jgi:hypothetical protein